MVVGGRFEGRQPDISQGSSTKTKASQVETMEIPILDGDNYISP